MMGDSENYKSGGIGFDSLAGQINEYFRIRCTKIKERLGPDLLKQIVDLVDTGFTTEAAIKRIEFDRKDRDTVKQILKELKKLP